MCIFACLLNAREQRRNLLLAVKTQKRNTLQGFLMNTFREISEQNSELAGNSTLRTY